jgi:hypothetical protein
MNIEIWYVYTNDMLIIIYKMYVYVYCTSYKDPEMIHSSSPDWCVTYSKYYCRLYDTKYFCNAQTITILVVLRVCIPYS